MSNINELLTKRLKKAETPSPKMAEMAKQSASGNLTSFSGVFSVSDLTPQEKNLLEDILQNYAEEKCDVEHDLKSLISLTSEVKAINNQAAILHGERIKKAQILLKRYKDGAFTAWLMAAYGNRQTPYNLMQYYEFYESLPKNLRPQIELMPRQAIYTLASREAPLEKKQQLVQNYKGETKAELLLLIRDLFPLSEEDKRKASIGETTLKSLNKTANLLKGKKISLTKKEKKEILELLIEIQNLIEASK